MKRLLVIACLLISSFAIAQPSNDNCSGAMVVPVNTSSTTCASSVSATTVGATESMPGCIGGVNAAEDDVWFKFTATQASHKISISYNSSLQWPIIEFFSGSCGALTSLVCYDQPFSNTSIQRVFTGLTPGTEYYFRFFDYSAASGRRALEVCVSEFVANDECTGAITMTVNTDTTWTNTVSGSLLFTSPSTAPGCSGGTGDAWYKFVATDTVHLLKRILAGSGNGFAMQVYSGACGGLTNVLLYGSTNPTTCAGGNDVDGYYAVRQLVPGDTYYIRVYSNAAVYTAGTYTLALSNIISNDECTNAIDVPVNAGLNCTSKTSVKHNNATPSRVNGTSCSNALNKDVWFKFTATAARHIISTNGSEFQLYSNTCGSLQSVFCSSNYDNGYEFEEFGSLVPGAVYYIRMLNTSVSNNQLCITTPGAGVVNDECANAIPLNANVGDYALGSFINATGVHGISPPQCYAGTEDIWYSFSPSFNTSASITLWANEITEDHSKSVTVFNGTCGALNFVACHGDLFSSPHALTVNFNALAGQTYYIRLTGHPGSSIQSGPIALSVEAVNALPVTITDFRIDKVTDKTIGLTWKTTQESEIKTYYIQRSVDGLNFTDIGSIPARNNAYNDYDFTDIRPIAGKNYYRLKIVSIDGKLEYSKIVDASLKGAGSFYVYAAANGINVLSNKNIPVPVTLSIYDEAGRQLINRRVVLNPGVNAFSGLNVPAGVRVVHLTSTEGSQVFRIVQ